MNLSIPASLQVHLHLFHTQHRYSHRFLSVISFVFYLKISDNEDNYFVMDPSDESFNGSLAAGKELLDFFFFFSSIKVGSETIINDFP